MSEQELYPGGYAKTHGDKAAYTMATTGESVTFSELHDRACRISQLFRRLGVQPGDHVAWCMENHPWFLSIAWGAIYSGAYFTAISSRLTAEEAAYIVNDCGAKIFISSRQLAEVAEGLVELTPAVDARFSVDGTIPGHEDFIAAVSAEPAEELPDAVAGVDMLYSSGTTGRPKGVKIPLPGVPLGQPEPLYMLVAGLFGANEQTMYLSPAPLYHAAPLRFCLEVQRAGGTVIVMDHFDPVQTLELIEKYRITFAQFVPTMFVRMLKLPEEVRSRYDVSSLQVAVHAAAPCPIEVKEQMIEWWGPVLHEYYAGTEGNGFCWTNSEDWLAHKGTVGKALIGVVHILDEDGNEVPTGEVGTVYFESPAQFSYHNDPEKTAESYNEKGYSTLGDVGRLDEDGYLYLTDRRSYMIISGGVNIYPQEAENILTMHPDVVDVAVFGIPNEDFGEEVKAVVQPVTMPADDEEAAALEAKLIAYGKEHLADIKVPRSIDFRPELPRHPTGKLYKRLLRDEYWADAGRTI